MQDQGISMHFWIVIKVLVQAIKFNFRLKKVNKIKGRIEVKRWEIGGVRSCGGYGVDDLSVLKDV